MIFIPQYDGMQLTESIEYDCPNGNFMAHFNY